MIFLEKCTNIFCLNCEVINYSKVINYNKFNLKRISFFFFLIRIIKIITEKYLCKKNVQTDVYQIKIYNIFQSSTTYNNHTNIILNVWNENKNIDSIN